MLVEMHLQLQAQKKVVNRPTQTKSRPGVLDSDESDLELEDETLVEVEHLDF